MELNAIVIAAAVAGFAAGCFAGWFGATSGKRKAGREKRKEKKAVAAAQAAQAEQDALLKADPQDTFDCHIAKVDVDRGAFVSVEYHLNDQIQDMKREKRLGQVLRIVPLGFDLPENRLAEIPELRAFILELHRRAPYLPVFLERENMKKYLLWMLESRRLNGESPENPETPPIEPFEQEIVGHATRLLSTLFPEDEQTLSALLDQLTRRLEKVCDGIESEWRAIHAPQTVEAGATGGPSAPSTPSKGRSK